MAVRRINVISITLRQVFVNQTATFQSSSYPIALTRLGGPNPHLKFVEVPGIEPATSWLVVIHVNP